MLITILVKVALAALVLSLCYLAWTLFSRKARHEDARREGIKAAGHKVWATLISKQPTGESTGSDTQVQYAVQYTFCLDSTCRTRRNNRPLHDQEPTRPRLASSGTRR